MNPTSAFNFWNSTLPSTKGYAIHPVTHLKKKCLYNQNEKLKRRVSLMMPPFVLLLLQQARTGEWCEYLSCKFETWVRIQAVTCDFWNYGLNSVRVSVIGVLSEVIL